MLLPIIFELVYFVLSLTTMPPLLITAIAFPAVFILPGMMSLAILRKETCTNILQLVVEGFFISTILATILTSVLLELGLSLTAFAYSVLPLSLVSILTIIGLIKKTEIRPSKHDILFLALAFIVYVALISCLSTIPRLFTPDETSYIFSARMGILDGMVPPTGGRPDISGLGALLGGRWFWVYLLASFLGSTGLPAYQAGLIGVGFLIMTALASSLIVKNKRLSAVVFAAVAINPLLFSFSILTLNDLAISFYAVFAVLFFVRSFSKTGDNVSLNIVNLTYSLIAIVVLTLIKPNLLVFLTMWIILVSIMLKYKLYRLNRRYKILFTAVTLPVLTYELFIDLPYVVSVWMLRSSGVGVSLGKFLFISPIEKFVGWFMAPWWNPAASTLFTHSFGDYLDYFYRLLGPEHLSLLVSAIILAMPVFYLSRGMRKELDKTVLASLLLLSLCLFYFDAVSSANLNDASRYSLWMIPLWISLALTVLQDIIDSSSFTKLLIIFFVALIFLWVNIYLSIAEGGVYVGYFPPSRIWTTNAIMIQLMSMTVIVSLLFLRGSLSKVRLAIGRKLTALNMANMKNAMFSLLIILILLNAVYFSSQSMEKSQLYEDHGLTTINDALGNFTNTQSLVFANNYIYMRPYVSDKMLQQGLLLPPPDTKTDFLKLLEIAPNNIQFLISDDDATTSYEYANNYIKDYVNSDFITPEKPNVLLLPNMNLTDAILKMAFDDANATTVIDHSGFGNNGVNHGAQSVEGYYGQALRFDGQEYVSIQNNNALNVQNDITISFFAMIEKAEPLQGYMILSKGYAAAENGSYDIFVWDGRIYFELGDIGGLSVDAEPYVGAWHNFVFTYDSEKMEIYADGSPVASKPAVGPIRVSAYDLEIGRDSEREAYYFVGLIDELQVSNSPLNSTWLVKNYYSCYALRIGEIPLPEGQTSLFSVVNENVNVAQSIVVKDSKISVNQNRTVALELQIDSPKSKNATILIATDRFTKVCQTSLSSGPNDVKFEFDYTVDPYWYEAGGLYWLHLGQTRVIVIEDGSIAHNNFISTLDLNSINLLLLTLLSAILTAYFVARYTSFRYKKT